MSGSKMFGATALCIALTATACGTSGASIATEPSTATTVAASTTTLSASQDVSIRMRHVSGADVPQRATLLIPPGSVGTPPVAVLLHGAVADRGTLAAMASAVADLGIPVLNASWTFDVKNPAEAAADAVCAVAYAIQNASSWGADPDRIIVMGHSGGGHIGMLAALAPERFPECTTASDAHVWAYIGMAGDPAAAAPGGNARRFFESDSDLLRRMDNYSHVGGNPELIARFVHGTSDFTVPIELTRGFHDALIAAGYDSKLIPITAADHFDPTTPTTEAGLESLNQLLSVLETLKP